MNRIEACFQRLKAAGETAFIPYITAGDPTLERSLDFLCALEAAGADIIEFGIPFSDPVGDGPVIQNAACRALEAGASVKGILASVRQLRERTQIPLLLFTYFNPVLAYGVDVFAEDAAEAGVDGVLCVDLPPEEAGAYKAALDRHDICTIFLTAPTTTNERLELISKYCTGFVYYVSQLGVTGERVALAQNLRDAVARIETHTAKPVAVGFGISTPEQARNVANMAEGVVVGSAIVRLIAEVGNAPKGTQKVEDFVRSLVDAAKGRS